MLTIRLILSLVVVAAISVASAAAQQRQSGNAVAGVVVDITGAVLPNAQVQLKNATGATVQATVADESGAFRIDRVPPGRYDILVTFEGFQPTIVHLTISNRGLAPLRVTLPLAAIKQEVNVGNASAEIKTDAASNLDASTVDQA